MPEERPDGGSPPVAAAAPAPSASRALLAWCAVLVGSAARMLLCLVAALGLIALVPALAGATSTVVMSESMSPGLETGDVVIVKPVRPADLRLGQVLLVDDPDVPGRLRLHRLVDMHPSQLILKGDANRTPDTSPVTTAAVHGAGVLRVPLVGLPVVWSQQGRGDLVAATAGALAVLAMLASIGSGARLPRARRIAVAARPATVLLVLAAAGGTLAVPPPPARAAFSGTTASPSNSLTTGTFTCPSRTGVPTASIYYSFMPASGTAETNLGSAGAGVNGTLSSASLRVPGTCQANDSPSVRFQAATPAYIRTNVTFANTGTGSASLWFKPTSRQGVLLGSGNSATTTFSTLADRQIYFTTGGQLAFAMRTASSPVSCAISATVTLNTWHMVVDVFDSSTNTMRLYLDGSATTCSVNNPSPQSTTGYGRTGGDQPIASDGAAGAVDGYIDEVATYSSVLSTTNIDTLYSLGH